MKKIIALALTVLIALSCLTACGKAPSGTEAGKEIKVGICNYVDDASLNQIVDNIQSRLKEIGEENGVTFNVSYDNCNADANLMNQIISNFIADGVDIMVGVATPVAMAMQAATEDNGIPVVFAAVSDPVSTGIVESLEAPGSNVTGTSDVLPVEGQLQLIRELQPEAKTIGIIYTTSESNSLYSIGVYEEKAADYGFTIDAVAVTAQSEVTQAVDKLLSDGVDCLSNLTDNNVVGVLPAILEKTNAAGVPVYGSEVEQVKLGCVAGAGLDYVKLGAQTGAMAAKILKGESTCADLPYEIIENYDLYVNSKALSELNITLPDSLAAEAVECGE